MKNTNLILDGNNIIFRAYYVVKNKDKTHGVSTAVVNQFFKMIKGYVETSSPKTVHLVWDKRLSNGVNYRKELIDYKGNRSVKDDVLHDIHKCINLISKIAKNMGIKLYYPWNLEADDVIAYLCQNTELCIVVSSDKDMLQLVSENTWVYNTTKNIFVTLENFEEFTGVTIDEFIDYKSINGDSADNIDGIPKYGEVKSRKLAKSKNWGELSKEHLDILNRNRKIITLKDSYLLSKGEQESYDKQIEEQTKTEFNEVEVNKFLDKYSLTPIKKDIIQWKNLLSNTNLLEEWFSEL